MVEPAERIHKLPRYLFAEIDRKVREALEKGVDVIRLGIGDPDTPTPAYIVERAISEVQNPANHRYPPDEGLPEFREAVSRYYRQRHGVNLDPSGEVVPLVGSKEGIANISQVFVNPGDINLVPDPGYPVYGIGTMFAGGEVFSMPLLEENGYLPDLEAIPAEAARRAKLMFINYPNNPTGATASHDFFERMVHFARRHEILICHDAAYSEISYDGFKPPGFLEVDGAREVGIEFNSLSKTFNMTGWRIGYAAGNARALEVLSRYKTNVDSGLFRAIQYAGAEALDNPGRDKFISGLKELYQERRDAVVQGFKKLGWPLCPPLAGFYVWAKVPAGFTSQEFATRVLEETGVVLTPGRGFGEYGEGYFRIALTVDKSRVTEAMDRIFQCFNKRSM